ncbi:MAG TPA: fumarylacetoacetate hydrolase family protein [Bauldia sp.]|nr:fumarylacetoacetate hydrolase family protein [Bauldia sp.]
MRIVSYRLPGGDGFGVRVSEGVIDLSGRTTLFELLRLSPPAIQRLVEEAEKRGAPVRPWNSLALLPVIPRPGKFICLGLNYIDHAKEGGYTLPPWPTLFMRGPTSLVAAGEPIVRPSLSDTLDYEAELAVVIGQPGRRVDEANALGHVAGYALFNDATVREYQRITTQWTPGKNFDGTGAFGPELVTPDELPPGAVGLRIKSRLNGAVMQDGNTADMMFSVARTISLLSEVMTLETGDVIAMGTPAGVGHARRPPVWMRPGDVCEIEIEKIGILSNPVFAEADAMKQRAAL